MRVYAIREDPSEPFLVVNSDDLNLILDAQREDPWSEPVEVRTLEMTEDEIAALPEY